MTAEPKHKDTGESMSEVIANIPKELSFDAIGIWHIAPIGRVSLGLSGVPMEEFMRRAIGAILDAGGVPVRHVPGSGYEWVRQKHYGTSRNEIIDSIVREWEPVPNDSYSMIENCPWFARPDQAFPNYVKMD